MEDDSPEMGPVRGKRELSDDSKVETDEERTRPGKKRRCIPELSEDEGDGCVDAQLGNAEQTLLEEHCSSHGDGDDVYLPSSEEGEEGEQSALSSAESMEDEESLSLPDEEGSTSCDE